MQITFALLVFILCLYRSVFADSSSCGDPPRIKYGFPIVDNPESTHGAVVTYVCRGNKVLVERGKVVCHFGQWVGNTPECKDINDDRTGVSSTTKTPSPDHNGAINTESSCGNPPRIKFGFPIVGNRTHQESTHGAVVTYVCRGNKVLVERGKVQCHFGQWVGNTPECKDIDDDHTSSATKPPSETSHRNGTNNIEGSCGRPPRIKYGYPVVSDQALKHGAVVTYICRGNKVLVGKGKIECNFGQWEGVLPECKDSLCIRSELRKYIGLKLPVGKSLNSTSFGIKCRKGYKPSNPEGNITCSNGKWIVPKIICTEGLCITSKLRKYIGLKLPVGKVLNTTSFEIKCRKGYKPSNPGENITCSKGKWIVPKTICIEDVEHDDLNGESSVARAELTRLRERKNKKKNESRNDSAKNETSTAEIP